MECGTPSVTTSIGAEGMYDNLPWNGFIEDNFEKFANKAIELYTYDILWKKSQQKGIEIINSLYDKDKLGVSFIRGIKKIQENFEIHRTQNFLGSLLQHQTLQTTKFMSKWIEEKNKK